MGYAMEHGQIWRVTGFGIWGMGGHGIVAMAATGARNGRQMETGGKPCPARHRRARLIAYVRTSCGHNMPTGEKRPGSRTAHPLPYGRIESFGLCLAIWTCHASMLPHISKMPK